MMLGRFFNWPELLAKFEQSRMNTPASWGTNDCCLYACDSVLVITGIDLASDFRGKYHDLRGALRLMGEEGVHGIATKMAKKHSIPEIAVLRARRGDVVLFESASGPTLGAMATDGMTILAPGEKGLERSPLRLALCAWRIG